MPLPYQSPGVMFLGAHQHTLFRH